jgi:hypothetical protein
MPMSLGPLAIVDWILLISSPAEIMYHRRTVPVVFCFCKGITTTTHLRLDNHILFRLDFAGGTILKSFLINGNICIKYLRR